MLKRRKRINSSDFSEILTKGYAIRSPFFVFKFLKSSELGLKNEILPSKFGISVSKKELKSAVDRNRVRRRVYSALRKVLDLNKDELNSALNGLKGVFITNKKVKEAKFSELVEEITRIISKIR